MNAKTTQTAGRRNMKFFNDAFCSNGTNARKCAQHLPHRHFSQCRVGIDHIEHLTHRKFTFTQCTLNFLAVCSGKYCLLAGGGARILG